MNGGKQRIIIEGKVVQRSDSAYGLLIKANSPYRVGKNKRSNILCFSKLLSAFKGKRIRLILETNGVARNCENL